MVVTMKNTVFWHVALCNVEVYGRWQNTLSCSSTLKMEAVSSSEISINFYQSFIDVCILLCM
jgi:hypothetical protein